MNDRIQKLALEAGKYADETQPLGSYTRNGMWLYAYNEKFAELIVRECIDQCADIPNSGDEYDKGIRWAANQIKHHFGVES